METVFTKTKQSITDRVRSLPMRNGNTPPFDNPTAGSRRPQPTYEEWKRLHNPTLLQRHESPQPTYEEWKPFIHVQTVTEPKVRSLPMRNGNAEVGQAASGRAESPQPTYEEWKRAGAMRWLLDYFGPQPTYEEWKL